MLFLVSLSLTTSITELLRINGIISTSKATGGGGEGNLPVVASAMHSCIRSAVVQTKFLGPGRDVLGTLHVVLATAPVRCCITAQVRWSVGPITFTAPFRVGNYVKIICFTPSPTNTQKDSRFAFADSTGLGIFFCFCYVEVVVVKRVSDSRKTQDNLEWMCVLIKNRISRENENKKTKGQ